MAQQNNGNRIRAALATDEKPIDLAEYLEFWYSLTAEERKYFRFVELSS